MTLERYHNEPYFGSREDIYNIEMLKVGDRVPRFELPRFGGVEAGFPAASRGRPSLLVFYKFSCPSCQLSLPFVQRFHEEYGKEVFIAAIAQDGPEETADFRDQMGLTLPVFMDMAPYPVSRQYGLISVPSIFLTDNRGVIEYAGAGFVKQDFQALVQRLSALSGRPAVEVLGGATVPDLRPG